MTHKPFTFPTKGNQGHVRSPSIATQIVTLVINIYLLLAGLISGKLVLSEQSVYPIRCRCSCYICSSVALQDGQSIFSQIIFKSGAILRDYNHLSLTLSSVTFFKILY